MVWTFFGILKKCDPGRGRWGLASVTTGLSCHTCALCDVMVHSSPQVQSCLQSTERVPAARLPYRVKVTTEKRYAWCACGHSKKQVSTCRGCCGSRSGECFLSLISSHSDQQTGLSSNSIPSQHDSSHWQQEITCWILETQLSRSLGCEHGFHAILIWNFSWQHFDLLSQKV